MTIRLLIGEDIRSHVLRILSGECLFTRRPNFPELYILSPWISDVVVEFSDSNIISRLKESSQRYYILDYNIKSINLAHALLLLKLHGGCEVERPVNINIVTLPPNERHYSVDYLPKVKNLLSFLDEVGCNIFTNSKLHSKVLLANDLALLGSFNLTSSALYHREEIGVSIDDLGNLDKIQEYCISVIRKSKQFGYSSSLNVGISLSSGMGKKITRGWILDKMIDDVFGFGYGEFLDITGKYKTTIESYVRNLNTFYLTNLRRLVSLPENSSADTFSGKEWVRRFLNYTGNESTDSIMEFLNSKFARKSVPDIKLRIRSLES